MSADVHSLIGAYALDALDDIERAAFDRHMRECEACRLEAAELRDAAARLADPAWSAPPPRLRENVLAEISKTRQVGPVPVAAPPGRARARSLRLVGAAAVILAVAAATTAVFVQEQRVRDAEAVAEAARASEARVRSVLSAPDVQVREQSLTSGGRVTVASSRLQNAGVIMLAADSPPASDRVYQLWTIRGTTPSSAGALGVGQSASVQLVEGLPGASAVGVTVEQAPAAQVPTTPLDALVELA
ncbi:anti-sigma factor [Actinoplanes sp. NPDC051861]|uniref:anti-sigma factor n=1 Tax=Actinoplanes sp. NPDC051861 TaxID=3155170 RepID=UPI00342D5EA4